MKSGDLRISSDLDTLPTLSEAFSPRIVVTPSVDQFAVVSGSEDSFTDTDSVASGVKSESDAKPHTRHTSSFTRSLSSTSIPSTAESRLALKRSASMSGLLVSQKDKSTLRKPSLEKCSSFDIATQALKKRESIRAKFRKIFKEFDDNGDGILQWDEFNLAMSTVLNIRSKDPIIGELFKSFKGHLNEGVKYEALVAGGELDQVMDTHMGRIAETPTLEELVPMDEVVDEMGLIMLEPSAMTSAALADGDSSDSDIDGGLHVPHLDTVKMMTKRASVAEHTAVVLTAKLNQESEARESAMFEASKLRASLQGMTVSLEDMVEKEKHLTDTLAEQEDFYEQQTEKLSAECTRLRSELTRITEENTDLVGTVVTMQETLDATTAELDRMKLDQQKQEDDRLAKKAEVMGVESQLSEMKRQIVECEKRIRELNNEANQIKMETSTLSMERDHIMTEMEEIEQMSSQVGSPVRVARSATVMIPHPHERMATEKNILDGETPGPDDLTGLDSSPGTAGRSRLESVVGYYDVASPIISDSEEMTMVTFEEPSHLRMGTRSAILPGGSSSSEESESGDEFGEIPDPSKFARDSSRESVVSDSSVVMDPDFIRRQSGILMSKMKRESQQIQRIGAEAKLNSVESEYVADIERMKQEHTEVVSELEKKHRMDEDNWRTQLEVWRRKAEDAEHKLEEHKQGMMMMTDYNGSDGAPSDEKTCEDPVSSSTMLVQSHSASHSASSAMVSVTLEEDVIVEDDSLTQGLLDPKRKVRESDAEAARIQSACVIFGFECW